MEDLEIRYRFRLEGGQEEVFQFRMDPVSLEIKPSWKDALPEWTCLEFHQCTNCPLEVRDGARCPAAVSMVELVNRFTELLSHDQASVEVTTSERVICCDSTMQRAICSLMGLLMATSRCPMTRLFKPMARFHLPFASTAETIWRATSTYLLAQYFKQQEGGDPDLVFADLIRFYNDIRTVNSAFTKRLRSACKGDSMVNAIVLLDMFAQSMPLAIDESLEEIRYLFVPYLNYARNFG
jgi:Domain of unknown function (DUF6901)